MTYTIRFIVNVGEPLINEKFEDLVRDNYIFPLYQMEINGEPDKLETVLKTGLPIFKEWFFEQIRNNSIKEKDRRTAKELDASSIDWKSVIIWEGSGIDLISYYSYYINELGEAEKVKHLKTKVEYIKDVE